MASYNKAIRYQPNQYESWYSKGNALLNLQQYPQAIASYDKAIEARTKAQNTPKFPIKF
ncbi:tetratricopeptide repeat protein [Dolichospermum compactum]